MTYKHGNWFCKPANEAEAKEIIARAVASGADNINLFAGSEWPSSAYGVFDEIVSLAEPSLWGDTTEYTIEQLREKFPLPGEREWNGEGLPPVGVDCQMRFDGDWIQAKIIGFDENHPIVKMHIKRDGFTEIVYRACYMCTFRPIRSERERWFEDALSILQKDPVAMPAQLMGMVYDALKSGDLKAPEVE